MEPISVELAVVVLAIVLYVLCGQYLENYRARTGKAMCLHESAVVTVAGVALGAILKVTADYTVAFNKDLFFYLVLPPVIFAQGYTLKRKKFFRYFPYISFFGVVGTLVNFSVIGLLAYWYSNRGWITNEDCVDPETRSGKDCEESISATEAFILAAVLSASDDIAAVSLVRPTEYPKLSALIFGEGILNDAFSIVLFHTLIEASGQEAWIPLNVIYQLVVSVVIGVACGLLNAKLLKSMPSLGEHPVRQSALVLLFGFLSYGLAEFAEISGILTIFFCGVTMAHYSWHSLVPQAQVGSKITLQTLADVGEAFSFAYVGLSMWNFTSEHYSLDFSAWMFFVMCASRLAMIFGLSFACSLFTNNFNLSMPERLAWSLGGMVRGCISWGQILQVKDNDMLVTTTLIVVMSSTVFFGMLLPVLIPKLGFTTDESAHDAHASHEHPEQGLLSRDSWLGYNVPAHKERGEKMYVGLAKWWVRFDEAFMKPYFGGSGATPQRIEIAMPKGDLGIAGSLYRLVSGEEHPLVLAFVRMQQRREAEQQLNAGGGSEHSMDNQLYEQMAQSFSAAYSQAGNDLSKASEIWLSKLSTQEQALLEAYQPFGDYEPPSRGTLPADDLVSHNEDRESNVSIRRPFGAQGDRTP